MHCGKETVFWRETTGHVVFLHAAELQRVPLPERNNFRKQVSLIFSSYDRFSHACSVFNILLSCIWINER